jgi:hypothetical protein
MSSHVRISHVLRSLAICELFTEFLLYILSLKPRNQRERKQQKKTENMDKYVSYKYNTNITHYTLQCITTAKQPNIT